MNPFMGGGIGMSGMTWLGSQAGISGLDLTAEQKHLAHRIAALLPNDAGIAMRVLDYASVLTVEYLEDGRAGVWRLAPHG